MSLALRNSLITILLLAPGIALPQGMLRLKTRVIETDPSASVAELASPNPSGRGHLVMQFRERPTAETVAALERRGIRVLGDVPDNGLLVSVDRTARIGRFGVHYTASIDPSDKISPLLTSGSPALRNQSYLVEFHPDVDMNQARALLLNQGLLLQENPDLSRLQLMMQLPSPQAGTALAALAKLDEVAYIFPASDDLARSVPARACAGALTVNGAVSQAIPTYGAGWDGAGLGAANLGYVFSRMTTQLDAVAAQNEIKRAMAEWSKVVNITWTQGTNASAAKTVNILFGAGAHGDAYPFDGRSGVLAHTFYPAPPNPEPIAGDMHFDDAEIWRIGTNTDLFSVALHELGHALGLGHSDDPTAVMYPYYRMVSTLAPPDKAAILTLYAAQGSASLPLALTVNTTPTATTGSTLALAGAAVGGTGPITVTWSSTGGASGTASGAASAWSIASVPLLVGSNTITITATAGSTLVRRQVSIVRQSTISTGGSGPDTVAPSITLTSPSTSTFSTTLVSLTVAGTASDNVGVNSVTWATNSGRTGTASGTATWSASIPLLVGNNTVTIRAYDAAGNSSWRSLVIARR